MTLRDEQHRPVKGKTGEKRHDRRAKRRNAKTVLVTINIRIAEPNRKGKSVEEMLKAADTALYQAGKKGRHCLMIAS